MFHNLRYWLQFGKAFEIKILLPGGHTFDGHSQAVPAVEQSNDLRCRSTAPGIEELLFKCAIPFRERAFPGNVMKRHRIDDCAVAVEQIGIKPTVWQFQTHASIFSYPPS